MKHLTHIFIVVSLVLFSCQSDNTSSEQGEKDDVVQIDPSISSFDSISGSLQPAIQKFDIDPKKDTLITCDNGTLIFFEANSLVGSDGSEINGPVSIEVQEFYSNKDFISRDLATFSGDKMLVSGGMLELYAFSGDQNVVLKEGSTYGLFFPKEDPQKTEPMQLFTSSPVENIDWQLMADPEPTQDKNSNKNDLLNCEFQLLSQYGHGISIGFESTKSEPSGKSFYQTVKEKFKPNKEINHIACENDLTVSINVPLDEDGQIKDDELEIYSDPSELDEFVMDFFKKMDFGYDKKYTGHVANYFINFGPKSISTSDDYNQDFQNKYELFKNKAMANVDQAEFNYYVFNSTSFGLINCDFFWEDKSEKMDLFVESEFEQNTKMYLIFSDFKSMMIERNTEDGNFVFNKIPRGEKARLFGLTFDNGVPKMQIKEITIGAEDIELNNFKEFTLSELNEQLDKI